MVLSTLAHIREKEVKHLSSSIHPVSDILNKKFPKGQFKSQNQSNRVIFEKGYK